jgi:hypothetical protein
MTTQLHAALIWGGEPIADVVLDKPGKITIGPVANATFTVPDLGLPEVFPIVSHGEGGYLLTMGNAMAGTVSVGGVRHQVTELVGAAPFAATPVRPGDWGVVDLDAKGLQLFFQLGGTTEALPARGKVDLDTILPAAAFSMLLHLLLILGTFGLASTESPFAWPGPRALTGNYLVHRIDAAIPPPVTPPTSLAIAPPTGGEMARPETEQQKLAPKKGDTEKKGREGKRGGPKAMPDAVDDPTPARAQVGLNDRANRDLLKELTRTPNALDKWKHVGKGGAGDQGDETGKGDDDGLETQRGADDGDGYKPQGDLDTTSGNTGEPGECKEKDKRKCGKGKGRGKDGDGDGDGPPGPPGPQEVVVDLPPQKQIDASDGLDPREIQKRMEAAKGRFGVCYQREFDRDHSLAGKITVKFTIAPDGHVASAKIDSSTMKNDAVQSCLLRNVTKMTFPVSGSGGIVRYPFGFQGGGK